VVRRRRPIGKADQCHLNKSAVATAPGVLVFCHFQPHPQRSAASIRAPGSSFPVVHYWIPERTGDPKTDYQRGRQHFSEAVGVSRQPTTTLFLAHVLAAMLGNLGAVESGFIDALLEVAQVAVVPPRFTEQEIAATDADPERVRAVEREMAAAIASKAWLPDLLRLTVLRLLSGAEGEFIGGAMTMIARMALNGRRRQERAPSIRFHPLDRPCGRGCSGRARRQCQAAGGRLRPLKLPRRRGPSGWVPPPFPPLLRWLLQASPCGASAALSHRPHWSDISALS
jgi:hypothetical protein